MSKRFQKIPFPNSHGKSLIVNKTDLSNYDKIAFDFTYFQAKSISINGFNNCYKKKSDAINAVGDLFETLKNINSYNKKTFFDSSVKKQFHYNEFTSDKIIDRIENVLIDGYAMPYKKVKEFERLYFEFSFNNGKRVIGTRFYDNIFSILFLDPNHLICEESCRDIKNKLNFSVSGVFSKRQNVTSFNKDSDQNEFLKMIIEDYFNGKYFSLKDIIIDLNSIIEINS